MATQFDQSLRFLRAVLPANGIYSLRYAKNPGIGPSGRPHPPNKVEYVKSRSALWDRMAGLSGRDVYFSTASFRDASSCDAANIAAKQAFYLDFDIDPKQAIALVLEKLVSGEGLPIPMFVHSGGGLHVWWGLKDALSREDWQRHALGLRALCERLDLPADAKCTADAARILRCPGTYNCKYDPAREVKLDHRLDRYNSEAPYPITRFEKLALLCPAQPLPAAPVETPHCIDVEIYYRAALSSIPPPSTYGEALEIGMCLHSLGWGEAGFAMWRDWYDEGREASSHSGKNEAELRRQWASFHLGRPGGLTMGTLVHRAGLSGFQWQGRRPDETGEEPRVSHAGAEPGEPPLPPDADDLFAAYYREIKGRPWIRALSGAILPRTYLNALKAIAELKIRGRWDIFRNRREIVLPWEGPHWQPYTDEIDGRVRHRIATDMGSLEHDPGLVTTQHVLSRITALGAFNPVTDYLDRVEPLWDGVWRHWLIDYCGAEDTELNRQFSQLMLIGAVRRARQPGAKFDHILIMEGQEDFGKSRAVEILAGEYFSDQPLLACDARQQQELIEGVWFYEIGELADFRKADADKLKAFITRRVDRTRKAYARHREDIPRSCVFIANTNHVSDDYISADAGIRRYWPVRVGRTDQDRLEANRDQLFAQAAACERDNGAIITLPESLRASHATLVGERQTVPLFVDDLREFKASKKHLGDGVYQEEATFLQLRRYLEIDAPHTSPRVGAAIKASMAALGWEQHVVWEEGRALRKYYRLTVAGDPLSETARAAASEPWLRARNLSPHACKWDGSED